MTLRPHARPRSRLAVVTASAFLGGLFLSLSACPKHGNDPSCGQLAQWYSDGVGCLNTPVATLGEIYAIDSHGASSLTGIGAFVQTTPATPAVIDAAPADCMAILAAPTQVSVGPAETYTFQPMQFNENVSVGYDGIDVEEQVTVGQSFQIATGDQTKTTLVDPVRSIECSAGALQSLTDYWNALSSDQQSHTAFFVVTQTVVAPISATATDSYSGGAGVQTDAVTLEVSISNGCNQSVTLSEPDGGGAPAFYDGQAFVFSPGTPLQLVGTAGACGALVSL